jgi:hypothetical protein
MGNRFLPAHDLEYSGPVIKGFVVERHGVPEDEFGVLFGRVAAHFMLEANSEVKETTIEIPEIVESPDNIDGNFFVRFEYDPVSRPRLDIELFAEDEVMKIKKAETEKFAVSIWSLINYNCGFFSEGMKLKVRYGYDLDKIYVAKFLLNLIGKAEKTE